MHKSGSSLEFSLLYRKMPGRILDIAAFFLVGWLFEASPATVSLATAAWFLNHYGRLARLLVSPLRHNENRRHKLRELNLQFLQERAFDNRMRALFLAIPLPPLIGYGWDAGFILLACLSTVLFIMAFIRTRRELSPRPEAESNNLSLSGPSLLSNSDISTEHDLASGHVAAANDKTDCPVISAADATKKVDGIYVKLVINHIVQRITPLFYRARFSPDCVTVLAFFVGLIGAIFILVGSTYSLIAGAITLHLNFMLDCLDGNLARYSGLSSDFGAWMDRVLDRALESIWIIALFYNAGAGAAGAGIAATADTGSAIALYWPMAAMMMATLTFEWITNLCTIGHGFAAGSRTPLAGVRWKLLDDNGIVLAYTRDVQVIMFSVFVLLQRPVVAALTMSAVATLDWATRLVRLRKMSDGG